MGLKKRILLIKIRLKEHSMKVASLCYCEKGKIIIGTDLFDLIRREYNYNCLVDAYFLDLRSVQTRDVLEPLWIVFTQHDRKATLSPDCVGSVIAEILRLGKEESSKVKDLVSNSLANAQMHTNEIQEYENEQNAGKARGILKIPETDFEVLTKYYQKEERRPDYRFTTISFFDTTAKAFFANFRPPEESLLEITLEGCGLGIGADLIENYLKKEWTESTAVWREENGNAFRIIVNVAKSDYGIIGPRTSEEKIKRYLNRELAPYTNVAESIKRIQIRDIQKASQYGDRFEIHAFYISRLELTRGRRDFLYLIPKPEISDYVPQKVRIANELDNICKTWWNYVRSGKLALGDEEKDSLCLDLKEFVCGSLNPFITSYFRRTKTRPVLEGQVDVDILEDAELSSEYKCPLLRFQLSNLKIWILAFSPLCACIIFTGKQPKAYVTERKERFEYLILLLLKAYRDKQFKTYEQIFDSVFDGMLAKTAFIPTEEEFRKFRYLPKEKFKKDSIERFGSEVLSRTYIEEKFYMDRFPIEGNRKLASALSLYVKENKEYLKGLEAIALVDIGSAGGALTALFALSVLAEHGFINKVKVTLVDIAKNALIVTKNKDYEIPDRLQKMLGGTSRVQEFRKILADANLINEDASKLSLPSNAYDVVVSGFTCHHMNFDDKKEACSEMVRITKPMGFIGVVDEHLTYDQFREYVVLHKGDEVELAQESFISIEDHAKFFKNLGLKVNRGEWRKNQKYYYFWCVKGEQNKKLEISKDNFRTCERLT